MKEMELTKEELQFLKGLFKIRKAQGLVIREMDNILTKGVRDEETNRTWARLTYKKICLEKMEKYLFAQDLIAESEIVFFGDTNDKKPT